MYRLSRSLIVLCITLSSASCAFDLVHVKQIPTQIDVTDLRSPAFQLIEESKIDLGTGYSRTLRPGTRWQFVGRIPQGDVYKTSDQVLTVEASNIHEAFIVTRSGMLVGFYLPVERSFSPLPQPKVLVTRELTGE